MGTPAFSVPVLDALVDAGHDIAAVYCQPPRRAGRGKQTRPSPVQVRAEALGLSVRHPASLRDAQALSEFAALHADAAVVVAYGLILPQEILATPRYGCLNIHASSLPRWRGAAPIHRAIMAGDTTTGVCIMQMDAGLDTGPVLLRKEIDIKPDDTTGDLHDRLSVLGANLILVAIDQIDDLVPQAQPDDGITYATKIDKAEARVNWQGSAIEVDQKIRGLSPFPGAWCQVGLDRVKLLRSKVVPGDGSPGQVLDGFTVACGQGAVEILVAQRPGRRPMPVSELLLGLELPDVLA